MPFTITVHHGSEFLIVEGSGPALLADLCGYMDLVGGIAGKRSYSRALLDLQGIDIHLSFTDHLTLGSHAADRLRNMERVASVVPERFRSGTSEKAAQKMGLQLRTFIDMDEGLAWLQGVH
jgi:hypothetical protein